MFLFPAGNEVVHKWEFRLNCRSFDDTPGYEKYRNRKPAKNSKKPKKPSFSEMVRRAHQRIIGAVHKKGNGFIEARNTKDAVATLRRWVRNDDGKLGRRKQVYDVLRTAFTQLCQAHVFSKWSSGFKLNPHRVVTAQAA